MTRTELYALVWAKPMIHVAKTFGLSDVGLRKICVKHNIPTPPLGYWAKLVHGKKVQQTPLPPAKEGIPENVHFIRRPSKEIPANILPVRAAAVKQEAAPENAIVVPTERPEKLHRVAAAVEKALKKRTAKVDHEGFLSCRGVGIPNVTVGPASVERAIRIIDTVLKAIIARGHGVVRDEKGLRIVVDGESFVLRVYEGKNRKPHEPTLAELKAQAERDQWRALYPDHYTSTRKAWRSWDYFPSGRLAMEITNPTRWRGDGLVGRWRDRPSKKLEGYLADAMISLVTASALVKHRRAEEAERDRVRAEEEERRRRELARRERTKKRREFLVGKAGEYAELQQMAAFAKFIETEVASPASEPVDRIARELASIMTEMRRCFERETLNEEIVQLELFGDDDSI